MGAQLPHGPVPFPADPVKAGHAGRSNAGAASEVRPQAMPVPSAVRNRLPATAA